MIEKKANLDGVALTGALSLIGTGWMDPPRPRLGFVEPSHNPSKAKKRARKAQRLARRKNRK